MDILVISNCSGDKLYDHSPIGCDEIDSSSREALLKQYPEFSAPAAEMYTGVEHPYVESAVENLREFADVSWKIVSAGYGLLDETDEIVAYDCSFSDIADVQERAKRMGYNLDDLTQDETRRAVASEIWIPSDLKKVFQSGYELVFLTLSTPYLIALSGALNDFPEHSTAFAIASNSAKPYIGNANWIPASDEIRSKIGSNWYRLRGELLEMISKQIEENDLQPMTDNPSSISSHLPC